MARSLAGASLEVGQVLADRGGVTFRAKGTCMYPTIRAGDVLRIQSCRLVDLAVGDIAVCRRLTFLFSHRIIETGLQDGRAYILTRPDGGGCDPPTFAEDLMGVVVAIERKGKPVSLQPAEYPWLVRRYFALYLAGREIVSLALPRWAERLARVQESDFYRHIARGWLALVRPRVSYTVRLPMPGLGNAVYRELSLESFDPRTDWRGRPLERWTLTLHLNGARQPAAWSTFARGPAGEWCNKESFISPLYRGTGLDEIMLRQADAILLQGCGVQDSDTRNGGMAGARDLASLPSR